MKTKCDTCLNNCIDKDYSTGYSTPYCAKQHWAGDSGEPYPKDWVDPWVDCKDYQLDVISGGEHIKHKVSTTIKITPKG